jgi:hypothetical protein
MTASVLTITSTTAMTAITSGVCFLASGLLIVLAALLSTYLAGTYTVRGFPESTVNQTPTFRLRELSSVARALNQAAVSVLDNQNQMAAELEDMRRLNELSALLLREENKLETCFSEIVRTAIAISGADKGNLQVFDEASRSLRIVADNKQRFNQHSQVGQVFDQLLDARLEPSASHYADLDTEVA